MRKKKVPKVPESPLTRLASEYYRRSALEALKKKFVFSSMDEGGYTAFVHPYLAETLGSIPKSTGKTWHWRVPVSYPDPYDEILRSDEGLTSLLFDERDYEDLMKLSFGKYAGTDLADVPEDYVQWLIDTREKDIKTYKDELARRERADEASQTMIDRIAAEGYKALVKRLHPDKGGTDADFRELTASFESLKDVLKEVARVTGTSTPTK